MYAIKPWGKVYLVGSSVGTYAMGIGMRWRESYVSIVEKRASPSYEREQLTRCVLTDQSVKLLTDLGCTESKLRAILRPTGGWRFMTQQLEVLKESSTFPGCAVGEASYHCAEGQLLRTLRSEFLRFGGTLTWGAEAFDAYENNDGTETWCLKKEFGLGTAAEAVVTTAKRTAIGAALIAEDPEQMSVMFDVQTGISSIDVREQRSLFGGDSTDVCIVVGQGLAIHLWLMDSQKRLCSWRLVRNATKIPEQEVMENVSPVIRSVISSGGNRQQRVCLLPGTTPAIRDDQVHAKISVLGDGLLPVDPFEWRGDNARCAVEEASALCRAFYGKKYHRGDVAFLLRAVEQDSLTKRANLLKRDLVDAEHFLAIRPALEDEPGEPVGKVTAD